MQLTTVFSRRRAVLISGGVDSFQNHSRYLNDLTAFYNCLRSTRYNFAAADIQVLYANGGVYSMGNDSVATREATEDNVKDALGKALLGNPKTDPHPLGPKDLLVVFTTNHGDYSSRLLLWGAKEYLTAGDFGKELSANTDHHSLGIFGHCYGADLIDPLVNNTHPDRAVAVAASTAASYALLPDCAYDAFVYHLTAAFALETPSGYPADADANKDGYVDVEEAYKFAKKKDTTADAPAFKESKTGLAGRLTLEGLL